MGKASKLVQDLGERMTESLGTRAVAEQAVESGGSPGQYDGFTRLVGAGVLPIGSLVADPEQPRQEFLDADVDRLAADIRAHGVLQPLKVRWSEELGKYVVIFGELRLRAARRAGLSGLPVICTATPLSPIEILEQQLAENECRTNLNDIDRARGFQRYIREKPCKAADLARFLHISEATVSKSLSLMNLDEAVQEQVASGSLKAKSAIEIARLSNPTIQREIAERAVKDDLPADQVAKQVRQRSGQPAPQRSRAGAQPGAAQVGKTTSKPATSTPAPAPDHELVVSYIDGFRENDRVILRFVGVPAGTDPWILHTILERARAILMAEMGFKN